MVPDIAEETGFHPSTVRHYFHRFGLEMGRTRAVGHHIDPKQLAKLRQRGLTVPQIADLLGCSATTIERAVRRYGIFRLSQATLIDRIDANQLPIGCRRPTVPRRLVERTAFVAFRRDLTTN